MEQNIFFLHWKVIPWIASSKSSDQKSILIPIPKLNLGFGSWYRNRISLTWMTSKMALPNILEIASNQCHITHELWIIGRYQTKTKHFQQLGVGPNSSLEDWGSLPFADNMVFHTENTPEKKTLLFFILVC